MTALTLPEPPNRRAALAWVVLQDAPTPTEVFIATDSDLPRIQLNVRTIAELRAWAKLIDAKVGKPFIGSSGLHLYTADKYINGWSFAVKAHVRPEEAETEPLDDTTREQLTAIAQDGAQ